MEEEVICEFCLWRGTAVIMPDSACPHCKEIGSLMTEEEYHLVHDEDDHPDYTEIEVVSEMDTDLPPDLIGE